MKFIYENENSLFKKNWRVLNDLIHSNKIGLIRINIYIFGIENFFPDFERCSTLYFS